MFAVLLARSAPFSGEEDEEVIFRADCKLGKLVAWLKQASAESSNDNFADAIWLEYHATLIAKFAHRSLVASNQVKVHPAEGDSKSEVLRPGHLPIRTN